jgi:hypothetical protein
MPARGGGSGFVGELNVVFAAQDDEAAIAILGDWGFNTLSDGSPVHHDDKLMPDVLAELESILTGRDGQEITADPRFATRIFDPVDEDGDMVGDYGLIAFTNTLTRALAVADAEALSAAAAAWSHGEYAVQGLATVARHAAAHGHRLYNFWYF